MQCSKRLLTPLYQHAMSCAPQQRIMAGSFHNPKFRMSSTSSPLNWLRSFNGGRSGFVSTRSGFLVPRDSLALSLGVATTTVMLSNSILGVKKTAFCQAYQQASPGIAGSFEHDFDREFETADSGGLSGKSFVHKGEISFGIVLGFCTGYLIKKVGKLFALAVGAGFVFLQYMSLKGFVTVHWDRLEGGYRRQFNVEEGGKVTQKNVRTRWNSIVDLLTHNLQFKSTFMIGLYAGIRYG